MQGGVEGLGGLPTSPPAHPVTGHEVELGHGALLKCSVGPSVEKTPSATIKLSGVGSVASDL